MGTEKIEETTTTKTRQNVDMCEARHVGMYCVSLPIWYTLKMFPIKVKAMHQK